MQNLLFEEYKKYLRRVLRHDRLRYFYKIILDSTESKSDI